MSGHPTEIIAVTSGKGGTGKTIISACLGYALTRAGHRVLLVDTDTATDGLSHFLLGPHGVEQATSFRPENTFAGILLPDWNANANPIRPRQINRSATSDHGVIYQVLISGRGLYGDFPPPSPIERERFRTHVSSLFDTLRTCGEYDYVIMDTRGGFGYDTTDVCALADSFILVLEAGDTSMYQARNLVREVNEAGPELKRQPRLRSILVNKALSRDGDEGYLDLGQMEGRFRRELVDEFETAGVRFEDTHPLPLDAEALEAYKNQQVPFRYDPAYRFSYAVLVAFAQILQVVTSPWSREQAEAWSRLVDSIDAVIRRHNQDAQAEFAEIQRREDERLRLQTEVQYLRGGVERHQRELAYVRETLEQRHQREMEDRQLQAERELARTQETLERAHRGEFASWRRLALTSAVAAGLLGIVVVVAVALQLRSVSQQQDLASALAASQASERSVVSALATSQVSERAAASALATSEAMVRAADARATAQADDRVALLATVQVLQSQSATATTTTPVPTPSPQPVADVCPDAIQVLKLVGLEGTFEMGTRMSPNRTVGALNPIGVMVHSTRSGTPVDNLENEYRGVVNFLANPNSGASAHVVVGPSSTCRMADDDDVTFHAGNLNSTHLGIQLVQPRVDSPFTDFEYRAAAAIVRAWCDKFGIPMEHVALQTERGIIGHDETAQGRSQGRTDPGPNFSWSRFIALVRGPATP